MTGEELAAAREARRRRRRQFARLVRLAFVLGLVATVSLGAVRLLRRPEHRPVPPAPHGRLTAATPAEPLAQLARAAGLRCDPISSARLVVDKSDLELRFYAGERLLKTYPVALGPGGLGDKQQRDDGCTPEGEFRIVERVMQPNPRRWGDVWMLLDYPLPEDAERGLAAGLISRQQRDVIVEAAQRREVPPQDTRLGSGIGIHIGGIKPRNWTQGCIALEREDGIEVCEQVRVGTPVTIRQ
jgi:hypothetical protein